MQLKVSVVIPVKDDPLGLRRTLDSLPRNDSLELILIDGGSSQETLSVINAHRTRLSYWESGLDSGIADAMNRGLARSTGDYVAILNAGDTWTSSTLTHVKRAVREFPGADVYHGIIEYVGPDGAPSHFVSPDPTRLAERMFVFHPTMFVSRVCYEDLGGYDTELLYAMDSEWCHRAVRARKRFHTIEQPLARMSLGGRSDVHYRQALWEYRKSLIRHGLAGPVRANLGYLRSLAGKFVNRMPVARHVARTLFGSAMARSRGGPDAGTGRDTR